jgi:hypothetical protein
MASHLHHFRHFLAELGNAAHGDLLAGALDADRVRKQRSQAFTSASSSALKSPAQAKRWQSTGAPGP